MSRDRVAVTVMLFVVATVFLKQVDASVLGDTPTLSYKLLLWQVSTSGGFV